MGSLLQERSSKHLYKESVDSLQMSHGSVRTKPEATIKTHYDESMAISYSEQLAFKDGEVWKVIV
ncbi:MAG: hypothetical protein WBV93_06855 [Anaerobacillus sp.]